MTSPNVLPHDLAIAPFPSSGKDTLIPGVGYLRAWGTTKPVDGSEGYAPGCVFHHTDGTDATALYVNEGTVLSCNFNAIIVAE